MLPSPNGRGSNGQNGFSAEIFWEFFVAAFGKFFFIGIFCDFIFSRNNFACGENLHGFLRNFGKIKAEKSGFFIKIRPANQNRILKRKSFRRQRTIRSSCHVDFRKPYFCAQNIVRNSCDKKRRTRKHRAFALLHKRKRQHKFIFSAFCDVQTVRNHALAHREIRLPAVIAKKTDKPVHSIFHEHWAHIFAAKTHACLHRMDALAIILGKRKQLFSAKFFLKHLFLFQIKNHELLFCVAPRGFPQNPNRFFI